MVPASLRPLLRWLAFLFALACAPGAAGAPGVMLLTIDGAIGPASAHYVVRGIERAAQQRHALVVLQIDTPGGLDTSMRSVIKAILTSPVPVAAFVAPGGARAASAGTYIVFASHIAAMAPGTNLGAATPVELGIGGPQRERPAPNRDGRPEGDAGGDTGGGPGKRERASPMELKQMHDAAAYLRGLAQMRGRNADWAERAVRESVSLTAAEALRDNVIEVVAADVPALLAQLDGRSVTVLGQTRALALKNPAIEAFQPDWRTGILSAITHPGVALLLMTIGLYGLIFEFMNPGFVAPGVIGAISLLMGLYALQLLPVNYAGLALIALGIMFMIGEAFLPSFGILGLGGVVAFVAGALMLIDTELPGYGVPPGLVAGLAVTSLLLLTGTVRLAAKTRRAPVKSGSAALIGAVATVEDADGSHGDGWVRVEGELWKAVSAAPLRRAQAVRVAARNGLVLQVVPLDALDAAGVSVEAGRSR